MGLGLEARDDLLVVGHGKPTLECPRRSPKTSGERSPCRSTVERLRRRSCRRMLRTSSFAAARSKVYLLRSVWVGEPSGLTKTYPTASRGPLAMRSLS